jgi:hypothetical protein
MLLQTLCLPWHSFSSLSDHTASFVLRSDLTALGLFLVAGRSVRNLGLLWNFAAVESAVKPYCNEFLVHLQMDPTAKCTL